MEFEAWWDTRVVFIDHSKLDYLVKTAAETAWHFQEIRICQLERDSFDFSAKITYLEMIIKEYETLIPLEKQKEVKCFVLGEDNR